MEANECYQGKKYNQKYKWMPVDNMTTKQGFWSISLMFAELLLILSAISSLSNTVKKKVKPRP